MEKSPIKIYKSMRDVYFTILSASPCAAEFYEIWHTRSTHWHNHVSFWHPKTALSHWLAASPLQQCTHCCATLCLGQALNPARPSSLKTVPARPKIRPGQEDVKSRRRLIKGDRRRLLRNYVGVRRRPEHAPSNPATTVNDRGVDPGVAGSWPLKICRRGQSMFWPPKMSHSFIENRLFLYNCQFHSIKDEQLDIITSLILVMLTLPSLCLISSKQTVSSNQCICCYTGLKVIYVLHVDNGTTKVYGSDDLERPSKAWG